jgi:hypothetical protein
LFSKVPRLLWALAYVGHNLRLNNNKKCDMRDHLQQTSNRGSLGMKMT